jgi:flagellar basal-body rod modification protein FlgD
MSIAGVNTVSTNAAASEAVPKKTLDKDDFLFLLVTQLKSQDPLKPMDSTEFTAQLAQFNSLEQLRNINSSLETLQLYEASMNNAQAVSFIGKHVTVSGNGIEVASGNADPMPFTLAGDAQGVFLAVYDSEGNLVRTIEQSAMAAGEHSVQWDGKDSEGTQVPDGQYTFEVTAVDENDAAVSVSPFMVGRVTGVVFKNGVTCVVVNNQEIPIGRVVKINEATGI